MINDKLRKLTRRLYPTGRAWNLTDESFYFKLHEGLKVSEANLFQSALNVLNRILPDNANFTEEDAESWEIKLQIPVSPGVTLEQRKKAIERKIAYPGTIQARQHFLSIQRELRAAGFDVYVHENTIPISSGNLPVRYASDVTYGNKTFGGIASGVNITGQIINSLSQADDVLEAQLPVSLRSTFFIGGEVFPSAAIIPANREREFRNLVLTLKPLHTIAFLFINYSNV